MRHESRRPAGPAEDESRVGPEGERQTFPDGSVWVRTHPVTHLHDYRAAAHAHAWHQLTFALSGHLEVETDEARALVPPDCAVWVPAGMRHGEAMWAPVTVRTLYFAPGALGKATPGTRTVAISPLLRELIVHVSSLGSLDRDVTSQSHLVDVLLDLVRDAPDVSLHLPTPHDPRARRLATMIHADPGDRTPIAELARRAGGSLRTVERCFLAETGLRVGEWRRRLRLFHALRLLERGASVGTVALDVGYGSPSAFTSAFTRHFGAPPTRRLRLFDVSRSRS
jgi:AraC-like DNA-binding protein